VEFFGIHKSKVENELSLVELDSTHAHMTFVKDSKRKKSIAKFYVEKIPF